MKREQQAKNPRSYCAILRNKQYYHIDQETSKRVLVSEESNQNGKPPYRFTLSSHSDWAGRWFSLERSFIFEYPNHVNPLWSHWQNTKMQILNHLRFCQGSVCMRFCPHYEPLGSLHERLCLMYHSSPVNILTTGGYTLMLTCSFSRCVIHQSW